MNLFNSNHTEIGSLSENLILNTAGKVKIRFGNKFIDLLDNKGNLNVRLPKVVTQISSKDQIKEDGFYLFDSVLYLSLGKEVIEVSNGQIGYIEYSNPQTLSEEQIKVAQNNIGLLFNSTKEVSIKEGIVFIGDNIYKVSSGNISEFLKEPLKSINNLNSTPNQDKNTLVWSNSNWKYMPIITQEDFNTFKKELEDYLQEIAQEKEQKDYLNVFDSIQYSNQVYTISNFKFHVVNPEEYATTCDYAEFDSYPKNNLSNGNFLVLTIQGIKSSEPKINDNSEVMEYTFNLKYNEGKLYFMKDDWTSEITYNVKQKENSEGEILIFEIEDYFLIIKKIKDLFKGSHLFVKQEESTNPNKFKLDYLNSQISLEETKNNEIIPRTILGDLDDTNKIYNDPAISFRTYNTKEYKQGLYSDQAVFNGVEFRGKYPTEEQFEIQDFPRYSKKLNKELIDNHKPTNINSNNDYWSAVPSIGWIMTYFQILPVGTIVMFGKSTDQIPSGWAICNGQNGTPDLRDKFIVGAGNSYSLGNTGGEKEVTLTKDQIPSHDHEIDDYYFLENHGVQGEGISGTEVATSETYLGPGESDYDNDTLFYKTHKTKTTGGGQAHENRPPYYALYFIMKIN